MPGAMWLEEAKFGRVFIFPRLIEHADERIHARHFLAAGAKVKSDVAAQGAALTGEGRSCATGTETLGEKASKQSKQFGNLNICCL